MSFPVEVRFMTLGSEFKLASKKSFASREEAIAEIGQYARDNGFKNVKEILGEEADYYYSARFTATTPNGRAGRNIAYVEALGE